MRHRHGFLVLAFLALAATLAAGGLPLPTAPPAAAQAAPVDAAVYRDLAEGDGRASFVLLLDAQADLSQAASIADWTARGQYVVDRLRAVAAGSQPALLQRLARRDLAGHVDAVQPFWIANLVLVEGDRAAVEAAAQHLSVAAVLAEPRMAPLRDVRATGGDALAPATLCDPVADAWSVLRVGGHDVWAAPYHASGQGIVVGVVDTGVVWDHPALRESYRGWDGGSSSVTHAYSWYNPAGLCDDSTSGTCDADDQLGAPFPDGHGTHVTGIAAGYEAPDKWIGVAPGAAWIHALACSADDCPAAATLASLQWMLAPTDLGGANPNPALRPHVVNNSWGGFGGSQVYGPALEALRAAGIVPVFAAGNAGTMGCGTLFSPGDNPAAFGVGSTNRNDGISSFSSRGPNPFSRATGPELAAPGGQGICSSEVHGGYGYGSGTSMAAPHVAGAVALLLSAEPDLIGQVDQIEELLRRSSMPSTSGQTCGGASGSQIPNNTFGWGRLDALAAVQLAWQAGTLAGAVTDAVSGLPVAGAEVAITRSSQVLTQRTAADGQWSFTAGSGVYDVAISAFGYEPWAAAGVSVAQDAATIQDAALAPLARAALSGQVVEAGVEAPGDPIPQATVQLVGAQPPLAAQTDAAGGFTLAGVPHGSHTLRVTAPGYAPAELAVVVSGASSQNAALAPAADYLVASSGSCAPVYGWIDASGGAAHNLGDEGVVQVALPAPFTFYGNSYSSLFIHANGFLSFGAAQGLLNGVIPFVGPANNAIYGFAADLNPAGGAQGQIYSKTLPDGRFVVSYHQVQHYPSGDPETFQIILDPASGVIVLQYQTVSRPNGALAGVENASGAAGRVHAGGNTPPLAAGSAVAFLPFSGAAPACSPLAVTLAEFSAVQQGGAVLVTWETNSELDNRGFNLYRGLSPDGPDRQLNATLIPSQSPGSPGSFVYTWEDRQELISGVTYYYWVEAVDVSGVTTRYGPVSALFVGPTAVRLHGLQASPAAAVAGLPWLLIAAAAGLALAARRR